MTLLQLVFAPILKWVRTLRPGLVRAASLAAVLMSLGIALAALLSGTAAVHAASKAVADPCRIPAAIRTSPPLEGGKPIDVTVGIVIVDLFEVKDSDQTFRADFVSTARWRDPRLSARARGRSLADCRPGLNDIWHPDLRLLNLRAQFRAVGESVRIGDDGAVRYEARVLGQFSSRLRMREFPFDVQQLRIRIASFNYGPKVVRLVAEQPTIQREREFSAAGWSTLNDYTDANVEPLRIGLEEFSRADHVIVIERQPAYYLWNFILPLVFIVLMAWTVFWLDPQSWGAQIGIATASAFTLVAFLVALRSSLPALPYLTRLDELVLGSTMLVFFALAEVIVTSRLAQTDRGALASRLDAYGRWLYIALFAGVIFAALIR